MFRLNHFSSRSIWRQSPQVWCRFEDVEPELAIQKICHSHGAILELLSYFLVMSSVHGVADLTHSSPVDSTVMVRIFRSALLDLWKVIVHAVLADAMAEVQRAVLHQEMFDRLPGPLPVAN